MHVFKLVGKPYSSEYKHPVMHTRDTLIQATVCDGRPVEDRMSLWGYGICKIHPDQEYGHIIACFRFNSKVLEICKGLVEINDPVITARVIIGKHHINDVILLAEIREYNSYDIDGDYWKPGSYEQAESRSNRQQKDLRCQLLDGAA